MAPGNSHLPRTPQPAPRRPARRQVLGGLAAGLAGLIIPPARLHAQQPGGLLPDRPFDPDGDKPLDVPFEQEMRNFVAGLARWVKRVRPDFTVLAMNGLGLARYYENTNAANFANAPIAVDYLNTLDGVMIEGLNYGRETADTATSEGEAIYFAEMATLLRGRGMKVLALDYAETPINVRDAYIQGRQEADLVYVAPGKTRRLDRLARYPQRPVRENFRPIRTLADARNYAMVVDSARFGTQSQYIQALSATNYDLLVLDAFHAGRSSLTFAEMRKLRYKRLGTQRLLFAYLNIGTAETFRYYWDEAWRDNPIAVGFLSERRAEGRWGEAFLVQYWTEQWRSLIYGTAESYLTGILQLGFDGVVLGNVDVYRDWNDL